MLEAGTFTCFLIIGGLAIGVMGLLCFGFSCIEEKCFIKLSDFSGPRVVSVKTAIKRFSEQKEKQSGIKEVTKEEIELIKRNRQLRKAEIKQDFKVSTDTKLKLALWVTAFISAIVFGLAIFCAIKTPAGMPINIVSAIKGV